MQPSPRVPDISQLLEMVHDERADLQAAFNLETETGRAGLIGWAQTGILVSYGDRPIAELFRPLPEASDEVPVPLVYRATVGLTGNWDTPSGIGQALRCSAAALDAVGFANYVIRIWTLTVRCCPMARSCRLGRRSRWMSTSYTATPRPAWKIGAACAR